MGLIGHWWELIVLIAVAALVLGPGRFVDVGSGLGKSIREFRRASHDEDEEKTSTDRS
jgi:TatA/E family protein of Tat protein translocase